jgi:hypothetical protein
MITRRIFALSMPTFLVPDVAWPQTVLLSVQQRQAILDAKALAGVEAARYAAFAPLFTRCARSYAIDNASLARSLTVIATAFTAASNALTAGARAVPENLPITPVLSARDLAPASGPSPSAAARPTPQEALPTQRERSSLPQPAAREAPNLAPNSATLTITPEPIALTAAAIRSQTAGSAEAWARIATGFRDIAAQTGIALALAATRFETASRRLNDAALAMLRARFEEAARESESADRLGNFEIQDLLATANENQTLASSVLRKLNDTASDVTRRIGG